MSEKELVNALLCGRPYFGPAMRALQGPPVRHQYLDALVKLATQSRSRGSIRILEIGSWAGASAITWAKALQKLERKGQVTCIDSWEPYFQESIDFETHYREMNEAAQSGKVLKLFLHNIKATNVSHMVDYIVGNAHDVLPTLRSGKFDIVYIDGSHVYENVRADIQDAKRLIRTGGLICGDDLELQKHQLDPNEQQSAVMSRKDYVYSVTVRQSYHPGVTEAVSAEFGAVSSWDGVWAMEKAGLGWTKVELTVDGIQLPQHIADALAAVEAVEVGQTRDFRLIARNGKYVAVAKSLGVAELFEERLGERELPPLLLTDRSLDEVRNRAVEIEEERQPLSERVGETREFNIVRSRGRFVAAAKSIGPTELLVERLGERDLPPVIFVRDTFEAVREEAFALEQETTLPCVQLVEEIGDYNLVKAEDRFIAVAKKLGPIDLFREHFGEREVPPLILLGTDLAVLRSRILNAVANSHPETGSSS
jgi:predicted O-methyltransferase YrrM